MCTLRFVLSLFVALSVCSLYSGKAAEPAPPAQRVLHKLTWRQIERYNTERGRHLIVMDGKIYDVASFTAHPGGKGALDSVKGKDASQIFSSIHQSAVPLELRDRFLVGELADQQEGL